MTKLCTALPSSSISAQVILACLFLFQVALQCPLLVQPGVVKSDDDGSGSGNMPIENCSTIIRCPNNQLIRVDSVKGNVESMDTQFNLTLTERMFNQNLFDLRPPMHNFFDKTDLHYYASEMEVLFQNLAPESPHQKGGFTLRWSCEATCTAPDASLTADTAGKREGFFVIQYRTGESSSEYCTVDIPTPQCDAHEMLSLTQGPMLRWLFGGKVDPGWKLLVGPDQLIYPNPLGSSESFVPASGSNLTIRSLPKKNIFINMSFYCLTVSMCDDGSGVMDGPARNITVTSPVALLSDKDGRGGAFFAPSPANCQWNLICPYDYNLFMPFVVFQFVGDVRDKLVLSPRFSTTDTVWGPPEVTKNPTHWQINEMSFTFMATHYSRFPGETESPDFAPEGFTFKYECAQQCQLGLPTGAPFELAAGESFSHEYTVTGGKGDMCRWEVIPTSCTVNGAKTTNAVRIQMSPAPKFPSPYSLVFDHSYDEFEVQYRASHFRASQLIYFPNMPWNTSVRALSQSEVLFGFTYSCENVSIFPPDQADQSYPMYVSSPSWERGILLTDEDGDAPLPFAMPMQARNASWNILCFGSVVMEKIEWSIDPEDVLNLIVVAASSSSSDSTPSRVLRRADLPLTSDLQLPNGTQTVVEFIHKGTEHTPFGGITMHYRCDSLECKCDNGGTPVISTDASCSCNCTAPYEGTYCETCPPQYNESESCSSCAISWGYTAGSYPECKAQYFVEFQWMTSVSSCVSSTSASSSGEDTAVTPPPAVNFTATEAFQVCEGLREDARGIATTHCANLKKKTGFDDEDGTLSCVMKSDDDGNKHGDSNNITIDAVTLVELVSNTDTDMNGQMAIKCNIQLVMSGLPLEGVERFAISIGTAIKSHSKVASNETKAILRHHYNRLHGVKSADDDDNEEEEENSRCTYSLSLIPHDGTEDVVPRWSGWCGVKLCPPLQAPPLPFLPGAAASDAVSNIGAISGGVIGGLLLLILILLLLKRRLGRKTTVPDVPVPDPGKNSKRFGIAKDEELRELTAKRDRNDGNGGDQLQADLLYNAKGREGNLSSAAPESSSSSFPPPPSTSSYLAPRVPTATSDVSPAPLAATAAATASSKSSKMTRPPPHTTATPSGVGADEWDFDAASSPNNTTTAVAGGGAAAATTTTGAMSIDELLDLDDLLSGGGQANRGRHAPATAFIEIDDDI